MNTQDFEKTGVFYLGRKYDLEKSRILEELLLYDSKDLTTHAVCVGMTGSGKTGLCIGLLEEAAIDGIPAIAIDPKGDLGNLMLTFPDLKSEDFFPWIDPEEAARKGASPKEYAGKTAALWKKGLSDWGQDGERIRLFQKSADVSIYTPGSQAGRPLSILRSFDAPSGDLIQDTDALRDRVLSAVSGLLTLVGIDTDPIRSREHILLSNILYHAWSQARSLDIAQLINEIQNPPFQKVGVFDLSSFFPAKDRFSLAMALNNLLASPGFSAWMEGDPLNIGRLLFTEQGRPRLSILSIAHLSDQERMFFVTLLLNEVVAWMRTQPGTSSLRALLYMDEIFGYFPPSAVPPSKKPMLTLLKQARAYGLGVVLATQNPVDLDYKGLSNTGTWFIGRLQTERDKDRVLDGLEGVSATTGTGFERKRMEKTISSLDKRVFLLHNVHEDEPVLFNTRWVLSYLRGPLTRTQIQTLMASQKEVDKKSAAADFAPAKKQKTGKTSAQKPMIPPDISQYYIPIKQATGEGERLLYRPNLYITSKLHFVNSPNGIDTWKTEAFLTDVPDDTHPPIWDQAISVDKDTFDLGNLGEPEGQYAPLSSAALKKANYSSWKKGFSTFLYQNRSLTLWNCPELKAVSHEGEPKGEFIGRLTQIAHEKRDIQVEKLRKKYAPKLATLQDRQRRALARLDKEKSQYSQQKMQTVISMGATVLGALFGRKLGSLGNVGRATTSVRGMGRAAREKQDIKRAQDEIRIIQERIAEMEVQFRTELSAVQTALQPEDLTIQEKPVKPRKSDIIVSDVVLVWTPWRIGAMGMGEPAY
ncbi:ATP-binding protein [Acidobacteriota bacterium]